VGGYVAEFLHPLGDFGPVPVRVTVDEDGMVLAVDLITDSYGVGFTMAHALNSLSGAVSRHYHFLASEGEGRLSSRLAAQLQLLSLLRAAPLAFRQTVNVPRGNDRVLAYAA
jgi:hypothetical protein